ncbi:MAG: hypothetical protein ACE5G6_03810 [Terriglobia bacterium]
MNTSTSPLQRTIFAFRISIFVLLVLVAGRWALVAGQDPGSMASKVTRPAACADGQVLKYNATTGDYECQAEAGGGGGSLPAGAIVLIVSGSCPSGFVEETALNGRMPLGTLAVNADVGTSGGSDSVTPQGTVSQPTFTGDPLPSHSHTFTGNALPSHDHGGGTYAVGSSTTGISIAAHSTANARSGGGSTGFTDAAAAAHSITDPGHTHGSFTGRSEAVGAGTPAGTNSSDSAGTPSGTVSQPTFTGTAFDNHPSFIRVIFCRKS